MNDKIILFNIKTNKLETKEPFNIIESIYDESYRVPTTNEIDKNKISFIKKQISKCLNVIPLFDINTQNIYLINKYFIPKSVLELNYRFPDKEIIKYIKFMKNHLSDTTKINKYEHMINFLEQLDLKKLYNSYILFFYEVNIKKDIVQCIRPSYIPNYTHSDPYYSKKELLYFAENLEINTHDKLSVLSDDELCDIITQVDISSDILLKHMSYISKNNDIDIIQFYSMQGSSIMNQHLRNMEKYKDADIEKLIISLWKCIKLAPNFDKNYTLFRFITNDVFLQNLKINDIYIEKGFMSTTRNPYKISPYFGNIVLKIKIPKNIDGIALSVELYSYYPEEQEILFPPNTHFRLIKINKNPIYYQNSKIKKEYVFEWIQNGEIEINKIKNPTIMPTPESFFDELLLTDMFHLSFDDKVKYMRQKYVNKSNIINIFLMVDNKQEKFKIFFQDDHDNSQYNNYFQINSEGVLLLYSFYNNKIIFFIEIGYVNNVLVMHVKYNAHQLIKEKDFLLIVSKFAWFFDVKMCLLHCNYRTKESVINIIGNEVKIEKYNWDYYDYFKNKIKKYDMPEITPVFSIYILDYLTTVSPDKILFQSDKDDIYQIYKYTYLLENNANTISDFFVWLIDNKCDIVHKFVDKISTILNNINNPFKNEKYLFDCWAYLYNMDLISCIK